MTKITKDNFAEYSPNLRRSTSPEAKKTDQNNQTLPEKLTKELKQIAREQRNSSQATAASKEDTNNDHSSGIKNV